MVGGYQIIDLKNHDFSEPNTFNIKGIYSKLKNTTKPILVTNLNISTILNSVFTVCTKEVNKFKLSFITPSSDYVTIIITEEDNVSVEY